MRPSPLLHCFASLAMLGMIGCYATGGSGVSGQSSLAPTILAQPQNQTVALAGSITFQVTGSGTPLPGYQWERSNNTGTSWTPLPGATGASYTLSNAGMVDNQAQYHVVLTDPAGSATSAAAILSVTANLGDCQTVASLAPQSVPTGICTGPDGNLWFTNSGAGQIGKLDSLTHQVSLVNLPNPACKPVGICTGPDGNLWFTEEVDGKLGVLTTGGVLNHEFSVGQGPTAIVTGSDGNLWVTLQTANQVGRMTPAGGVTLYPVPTANAAPTGITLAADGSIWFAEQNIAQIAQISPAGSVTEWALQMPAGGVTPVPVAVTTTSDGAVWYTDLANNCVGKFVPPTSPSTQSVLKRSLKAHAAQAEDVTLTIFFPLGAGASPNALTTDSGGSVWVTEQGTGQVAEITVTTPAGTAPNSFDLPTSNGTPAGIVQGPDGNFWVTQPGTDNVAMVVGFVPANTVTVLVLPPTLTMVNNATQTFTAIVEGTPTLGVTWSVLEGAAGGTITPDTGLYVAPGTAGVYHVVATSNAVTPAVTGTVAVTVTVPAISAITPANPTVQAGNSLLFSAQVTGLADNSIIWSASDGVMNPSTGVWTAPNTAETVTITATSNQDSALFTTTLATIPPSGTALPAITTPPANQTVSVGSPASFSVVVSGVTNPSYQWQLSTNNAIAWTNIPGATGSTYAIAATTLPDKGNLYQVVVTSGLNSVTSAVASLTITNLPPPSATVTFNYSPPSYVTTGTAVGAQVPAQAGCTYLWTILNGTITGSATQNQVAFTPGAAGLVVQLTCVVTAPVSGLFTSGSNASTIVAFPVTPTLTVSANPTTAGATGLTATVSNAQAGFTYAWTFSNGATGGTITAGATSSQITFTAGSASTQLTCVGTSPTGAVSGTSAALSITIDALPPNNPAITAVTAVAANAAGCTASVSPVAGCTYNWTVSGGTRTDGGGTSASNIIYTAGASGTIVLTCSLSNAALTTGAAGSATVVIDNVPTVGLSCPDLQVAPGMGCLFTGSVTSNSTATLNWVITFTINGTTNPPCVQQTGTTFSPALPLGFNGNAIGVTVSGNNLTLANLPAASTLQVQLKATNAAYPSTPGSATTSVSVLSPYASGAMAAGDNLNLQIQGSNVWACGLNNLDQMGDGGEVSNTGPFSYVQISGYAKLANILRVDSAGDHSLALASANAVYWWGKSATAGVANGNVASQVTLYGSPTPVMLANNANTSFVLMADGSVQAWAPGGAPTGTVSGLNNAAVPITAIAALDSDFNGIPALVGLDSSGHLWATEAPFTSPANSGNPFPALPSGLPAVALFAGKDSDLYVLDSAGTIYEWPGTNGANVASAVTFPGATGKCVGFAKGNGFQQAIGSDQTLWANGANDSGQLGQGNNNTYSGFTQNPTITNVQFVAAGTAFAMALDASGHLWTWGSEGAGELADFKTCIATPAQVPWQNPPPANPQPVTSSDDVIVLGAIPSEFWIWGTDPGLYLNTSLSSLPGPVVGPASLAAASTVYSSPLAQHALAIDAGTLYSWGLNTSGQLGSGTQGPLVQGTFQTVTLGAYPPTKAAAGAAHSFALDTNNDLWAWGNNTSGQLGISSGPVESTAVANSPVKIPVPSISVGTWANAAGGNDFSIGLTSLGDVYTWGADLYGQLGTGISLPDTGLGVPSLVTIGTAVTQVCAGAEHALALDSNGTVWAWGHNQAGQVGVGSRADVSTPHAVLGLTIYSPTVVSPYAITQIVAGPSFSLALDNHGNVYAWGDNAQGALGILNGSEQPNLSGSFLSPQPLTNLASWYGVSVSSLAVTANSVVAVDSHGHVWTWGWDQRGRLGLGAPYYSEGLNANTTYFNGTPTSPGLTTPEAPWAP